MWTKRSRAPRSFSTRRSCPNCRSVRLIHGYGTGQLRRAIAEYLRDHKFVERFASAPPEQGGGGVTVVEFKE